jgi:microcystin degradation protein MlrC
MENPWIGQTPASGRRFRASFDEFAPPERILEVDCPGLTTPKLKTLPWTRRLRPIFPIDEHATWSP